MINKKRIRLFCLFLFVIPIIDILIFNGASTFSSATVIMTSLVVFFILSLININRITNSFDEMEKEKIRGEINYRKISDMAVTDIQKEINLIKDIIEKTKPKLGEESEEINKAASGLKNLLKKMDIKTNLSEKGLLIDRGKHEVKADDNKVELTPTEFELLWALMEKKDRVLSREYLLRRIWGYDCEITTRSVDIAIMRLRKKIGDKSKYIKTVTGVGYKFNP